MDTATHAFLASNKSELAAKNKQRPKEKTKTAKASAPAPICLGSDSATRMQSLPRWYFTQWKGAVT